MVTRIPTQTEYEARELQRAHADETAINAAPLSERREARTEFAQAMRDPALIAQRIGWLIEGCYGFGSYRIARDLLVSGSKPASIRAILNQMIAVWEWRCPRRFAVEAWKGLSDSEKAALHAAIDAEISSAMNSIKEGE